MDKAHIKRGQTWILNLAPPLASCTISAFPAAFSFSGQQDTELSCTILVQI